MRARDLLAHIKEQIAAHVRAEELDPIAGWLLEHLTGLNKTALIINDPVNWTPAEEASLSSISGRLAQQEPIQHILGYGVFYGRDFEVGPAVLIPRPETEELVHWVLSLHKAGDTLLDIGTGSGCIPITLAAEGKFEQIAGLDVSVDAIQIANNNARRHDVKINWILGDILIGDIPLSGLDFVVSNPPYIREQERKEMQPNVLNYEPGLALFVADDDPLLFYRRIALLALERLRPGGHLLFEINEAFGKEMKELLAGMGYIHIELRKDMQGKDRMIKGQTPLQKTTNPPEQA